MGFWRVVCTTLVLLTMTPTKKARLTSMQKNVSTKLSCHWYQDTQTLWMTTRVSVVLALYQLLICCYW